MNVPELLTQSRNPDTFMNQLVYPQLMVAKICTRRISITTQMI